MLSVIILIAGAIVIGLILRFILNQPSHDDMTE